MNTFWALLLLGLAAPAASAEPPCEYSDRACLGKALHESLAAAVKESGVTGCPGKIYEGGLGFACYDLSQPWSSSAVWRIPESAFENASFRFADRCRPITTPLGNRCLPERVFAYRGLANDARARFSPAEVSAAFAAVFAELAPNP